LGDIALPHGLDASGRSRVQLAFRPHAVALHADHAGGAATSDASDASLHCYGAVEGGEFLGEFMRYEIRVRDAVVLADQPHFRGSPRLEQGTQVRVTVPSGELRLLDA
jgi:iron(III) transport system ATP-binding protein